MIFQFPAGTTYAGMASYVDRHAYRTELTPFQEGRIYEDLYFLYHMLAVKGKLFRDFADYDDFSLYAATETFLRYKNPKQFELNESGEPRLEKIKSCLNYVKGTLYPYKVRYEQTYFSRASDKVESLDEYDETTEYSFRRSLETSVDELARVEFDTCLGTLCEVSYAFIKATPYGSDRIEFKNVYISCLLTFLNSITLSYRGKKRIEEAKRDIYRSPEIIENIYKEELADPVILYHLEPSMKDYIYVLTKEMKHTMAVSLTHRFLADIPVSSVLSGYTMGELNSSAVEDEDIEGQ